MIKFKRSLLFGIVLTIFQSCTKDLDFNLQDLNTTTNISISVPFIENSFIEGSNGRTYQEVFVYSSYNDFIMKGNPIGYSNVKAPQTCTIISSDIDYRVLYLRAHIYYSGYGEGESYYYYNNGNAIEIPSFETNISIITSKQKWTLEK